jgi:LytS/YehU family sensor histidine kinase
MVLPEKSRRFILYLWIGLPFLLLWIFFDLSRHPDTAWSRIANNLWRVSYVLVMNYLLFEHTLPAVFNKRRNFLLNLLLLIPAIFVHLMLYSFGLYAWRFVGIGLGLYTPLVTFSTVDEGVEQQMSYSMSSIFFFGIVRHLYFHLKLRQATQQLRIEKQQAELNYLKSQTNPHFLFNTLNNIYALSREKSDLAPESILRLSKILRFMLYETSGEYIAVEQELKIIGDYIALEKLRYDESLRVSFHDDIDNRKQALPPLLLMPLVENAFKHGVSETRGQAFVDIHLSIKQRQLLLVVKNSVEGPAGEKEVRENIGLSNLRRQLQLLYTDYNLSVNREEHQFSATLKINLASHV